MADKKKQLVWNIIDFLKTSQQDGTVKEDDKESLDVASKLIEMRSWSIPQTLTMSNQRQFNALLKRSRWIPNPLMTIANTASSPLACSLSLKWL
jgi:hypothetical protein